MRQAVITGLGIVAPNGTGKEAFWESLLARRGGIREVSLFDTTGFPRMAAGEVVGFSVRPYLSNGLKPHRLARHTQLALAAARLAVEDAKLDLNALAESGPIPMFVSVSNSAFSLALRNTEQLLSRGPQGVSPSFMGNCHPHSVASTVSESLHIPITPMTVAAACTGGLQVLTSAADLIRNGGAHLAIAGAAESPIDALSMAAMRAAGMIPELNGCSPETISRPFDRLRRGGLPAEGAGFVIVEELRRAMARGAHAYAEIKGWHFTNTKPDRGGLAEAIDAAMDSARVTADQLDYICAHGPSDQALDRRETEAIKRALGAKAYRIPVSSIKGVTGNPFSASGPLQAGAASMAISRGIVPPTANYEHPDPDCDLDYVPGRPRNARLRNALINGCGLGGTSASVVFGAVPE